MFPNTNWDINIKLNRNLLKIWHYICRYYFSKYKLTRAFQVCARLYSLNFHHFTVLWFLQYRLLKIYLFSWESELQRERERDDHNGKGWIRLKPEVRNFIQVSHMHGSSISCSDHVLLAFPEMSRKPINVLQIWAAVVACSTCLKSRLVWGAPNLQSRIWQTCYASIF